MFYRFCNNLLLCYRIRTLSSAYRFFCQIVDSFLIRIFGLCIPRRIFRCVDCPHLCLPKLQNSVSKNCLFGCCKCPDINSSGNRLMTLATYYLAVHSWYLGRLSFVLNSIVTWLAFAIVDTVVSIWWLRLGTNLW